MCNARRTGKMLKRRVSELIIVPIRRGPMATHRYVMLSGAPGKIANARAIRSGYWIGSGTPTNDAPR